MKQFGTEVCRPDLACPHYQNAHAEFKHVTRLSLWEGLRSGDFCRAGGGGWKAG